MATYTEPEIRLSPSSLLLLEGRKANQNGNSTLAEVLFAKSADDENPFAMMELGKMYQDDGNMLKAEQWFEKAAKLGSASAMYKLGCLLQRQGDTNAAFDWYDFAMRAGESKAANALNYLTAMSEPPEEQFEEVPVDF